MTKKIIITLSIIALFANGTKASDNNSATHDEGIVINGVRWATRNVGAPGTFAESPEAPGMTFQWNRQQGWATTDAVIGWDSTDATGTKWEKVNDPCPQGWRIPTREELKSLVDAGSTWQHRGRFFGTAPYQIFLPAAGWHRFDNQRHILAGRYGSYWSSTQTQGNDEWAWHLYFGGNLNVVRVTGSRRAFGYSIRCVEDTPPLPLPTIATEQVCQQQQNRYGVPIAGTYWATRNVNAPGTFTQRPEDYGMLFQWNRRRGWATTGEITGWSYSADRGTGWERANDPCPDGWRVPKREELLKLVNAGSVWTTQNGVNGHVFGTAPHQIFLPAAGRREGSFGRSRLTGTVGVYWSSVPMADWAWSMGIGGDNKSNVSNGFCRSNAFSIRCVRDIPPVSISIDYVLATTDEGVVIDGIRWATRNVDAPGTFAATPESVGMFFQWNRRQGWAGTGDVLFWDSSNPTGTEWERANDPCPQGWRIPTREELETLGNVSSIWTTQNGVDGRLFGTAPYQLFLPAAGFRWDMESGLLYHVGTWGHYWSNKQDEHPMDRDNEGAWSMDYSHGGVSVRTGSRASGLSIRCVAIEANNQINN